VNQSLYDAIKEEGLVSWISKTGTEEIAEKFKVKVVSDLLKITDSKIRKFTKIKGIGANYVEALIRLKHELKAKNKKSLEPSALDELIAQRDAINKQIINLRLNEKKADLKKMEVTARKWGYSSLEEMITDPDLCGEEVAVAENVEPLKKKNVHDIPAGALAVPAEVFDPRKNLSR
jgi:hypothetical protein